MGRVTVTMKIWNDLERARSGQVVALEVETVVDTGAMSMAVIPEELADRLGLERRGRTRVRYANGSVEEREFAVGVGIEVLGRECWGRVIVEKAGSKVLLGQLALEDMDLVVDCRRGTIGPNPASPDMPLHEIYGVVSGTSRQESWARPGLSKGDPSGVLYCAVT